MTLHAVFNVLFCSSILVFPPCAIYNPQSDAKKVALMDQNLIQAWVSSSACQKKDLPDLSGFTQRLPFTINHTETSRRGVMTTEPKRVYIYR